MPDESTRWNARIALWLACAWVAAGALFKLFSGSPSDLPETVRSFPLLKPEWTFKLAIGIELSIVIVALARPRVGWVLLALLFAFFDFLLWQMMQAGETSCGCFGSRVPLQPWQMMAIDSALLLGLLLTRVWRGFEKRPLMLLPLLPVLAVVLAVPWFTIQDTVVQVAGDGSGRTEVVAGDWAQLQPAKWEGQVFPDTDLAGFLAGEGDADSVPFPSHVVLYRLSCEHCKEHLEKLLESPRDDGLPLVLIRIPESGDAADVVTPVKEALAVQFEFALKELPRGYGVTTPVLFDLDDAWTITGVQEQPE